MTKRDYLEGILSPIRVQLDWLEEQGYIMWQSQKNGGFYIASQKDYDWAQENGEYPDRTLERAGRFIMEI